MLALVSSLLVAAHPGLFFSQSDVGALRESANGTHKSISTTILDVLNAHLSDPAPTVNDYDDPRFHGNAVLVWAFGYQITGNTAYADHARTMLLTYLTWSDWGFGEVASLGEPDINTGHMLIGVATAYDWLYPYLSASDRSQIATRLGAEADKMAQGLPNAWYVEEYVQNHNWISTAGLGLAALALQGEDSRAAGWLSLAQGNLQKLAIVLGMIGDGSFHEGIPYEGYGLSMSLPFWTALARTGSDYTDLGILRGFGKYWLYAQIPDNARQTILPFGDFTGWPTAATPMLLRYNASRFRDGLGAAAAQRWVDAAARGTFLPERYYDVFELLYYDPTVTPTDPHTQPLEGEFADIGAAVLHSSWDAGDLAIGFKAGPYGGHANFDRIASGGAPGGWLAWGHDHNDDMSFWMFGNGTWLAPEALGYTAGVNTGVTNAANFTAFHNGLLVDGTGELGDVRSSDSNWNNPWFFKRNATLLVDPVGTADYSIAGGRGASLFDASLGLQRWDRIVVLAKSRYAIVRDDVVAAAAHAFDWICHFQDGVSVDSASGWVQGIGKNGKSLGVRVLSPQSWTATTGTQTASLMNVFDPDNSTSYVRVRPSAATSQVQFLTALWPVATTSWAQRATINALSSTDPGAGAIVSPGSALEERWIFGRVDADGKAASDLTLMGALAGVVGRDASGAHRRAAIFGAGKIADQNGGRELLSSLSASAIEADLQGTQLVVTGSGILDFHAYAPAATSVMVNGQVVAANYEAGMVTYPAAGSPPPSPDGGTADGGAAGGRTDAGTADGGAAGPALTVTSVGPMASCSTTGLGTLWPLLGILAVWFRRRR